MTATTTLPNVKINAGANSRPGHWAARSREAKAHRQIGWAVAMQHGDKLTLPLRVILTRIAPRALDGDNLANAFKGIRDGLADALLPHTQANHKRTWADDSDPRIQWEYRQEKSTRPRFYAVKIEFAPIETEPAQ